MRTSSRFFNNPMTLLTPLPSFLSHQHFKFDGIDPLAIAFAPLVRKLPTLGADPGCTAGTLDLPNDEQI